MATQTQRFTVDITTDRPLGLTAEQVRDVLYHNSGYKPEDWQRGVFIHVTKRKKRQPEDRLGQIKIGGEWFDDPEDSRLWDNEA